MSTCTEGVQADIEGLGKNTGPMSAGGRIPKFPALGSGGEAKPTSVGHQSSGFPARCSSISAAF
eukprot:8218499-Pyramimonas_sp.AAC.1